MKKKYINYTPSKLDMLAKMFPSLSLSVTVLLKSHHLVGLSKWIRVNLLFIGWKVQERKLQFNRRIFLTKLATSRESELPSTRMCKQSTLVAKVIYNSEPRETEIHLKSQYNFFQREFRQRLYRVGLYLFSMVYNPLYLISY